MKMSLRLFVLISFLFVACDSKKAMVVPEGSVAEKLLAKTLEAHGGQLYNKAKFEFIFRDKKFSFRNNDKQYEYTVLTTKDGNKKQETMTNDNFSRKLNGVAVEVSELDQKRYGASLNSVIYFATLPHKLLDPAVKLAYIGRTTIKDHSYEILKVTFDEQGGGQDHDDQYYYWINTQSNLIDYFAYNYTVSGGGVRFRAAYNTRRVAGIIFQDYINYKAPIGTALADLPGLYMKDKLKQLSVIATEDVKALK